MKIITLIVVFLISSVSFADMNISSSQLTDKKIITILDESLTNLFEAHGKELFSSFDGIIKNPLIINSVTINNKLGSAEQIKVSLTASFSTYDYDFGDPVDELIETFCQAILTKNKEGVYSEEMTKMKCDKTPENYIY